MTVVIEDPLHPGAAHGTLLAVGEDGGILPRDGDLVVEAIRHPAADLRRRRLAGVQHEVERVVDVIDAPARSQLLLELSLAPGGLAQSSISRPSHATSTPRRSSSACSGELSSRIGLVLFTWIRILRTPAGSLSSHSSIPPGPLCGRCPMSRALLRDSPSRILSSSLPKVPSMSTHCAARSALHNVSSMAPTPGAYTAPRPPRASRIRSATLSPATGDS